MWLTRKLRHCPRNNALYVLFCVTGMAIAVECLLLQRNSLQRSNQSIVGSTKLKVSVILRQEHFRSKSTNNNFNATIKCSQESKRGSGMVIGGVFATRGLELWNGCFSFLAPVLLGLSVWSHSLAFPMLVASADTQAVRDPASNLVVPTTPMSPRAPAKRYWDIMKQGTPLERSLANEKLIDHAVGTINTMYYDLTGGFLFQPPDFYYQWRHLRDFTRGTYEPHRRDTFPRDRNILQTREGAVRALKWVVSNLNDPFSKYLTREELQQELQGSNGGFLGSGAIVEPPQFFQAPFPVERTPLKLIKLKPINFIKRATPELISTTRAANLPIISAIFPDSPAERAGLTVGDRIVAAGSFNFVGDTTNGVAKSLKEKFSAENYAGYPDLTVGKPVWSSSPITTQHGVVDREVVVGYRISRIRLPTASLSPFRPQGQVKGDAVVHYELLTSSDSILDEQFSLDVGYIRLTRFSRSSTAGFLRAIQDLEAAGAKSYIFDLRNCYGGVIQEAMLTASAFLRDPHAVLTYTMNARGGFTPHDVEEYIVDTRFPGYLLSSESKDATLAQARRDNPAMFERNGVAWVPPSSFASLHEQSTLRGINVGGSLQSAATAEKKTMEQNRQLRAQKKIVLLINEGTASSAEVFASALHDNGRALALVGTKSYGKGKVQHSFPMPDGGGLRLTVAEYLTPSLRHVTNVGGAQYDRLTGQWVGGGIRPDIVCDSKQGIPSNAGADICVGIALDALENAEIRELNMR